jgi:hypothetical protein
MKRILIAVLVFVMAGVGACAQFSKQLSFPNWYVGLYGGLNAFMSENNMPGAKGTNFTIDNNVNPIFTVGVGYDISKLWSARGQLGWVKYKWSPDGVEHYHAWAATLTADMMLNVTRLIADYDPNRNFEFQVFLGSGAAYRPKIEYVDYTSDMVISPIARAGIQASFFVSRRFAISLDLATNFVSDRMDDVVTRHFSDNYTSLMLGFTYHIVGCQCHKKPLNMTYPY